MSGGSLDYIYYRVEDVAETIKDRAETPLQKAFAEHLLKVAKALHDVEWVFSGDYGEGDDAEAIKAVLGPDYKSRTMDVLRDEANILINELKKYTE
jgi:hypothetical protein